MPEQLQCTSEWILYIYWNSTGGMNTILPKDIPLIGLSTTVVESDFYHVGPTSLEVLRSPVGLRLADCEGDSHQPAPKTDPALSSILLLYGPSFTK